MSTGLMRDRDTRMSGVRLNSKVDKHDDRLTFVPLTRRTNEASGLRKLLMLAPNLLLFVSPGRCGLCPVIETSVAVNQIRIP